MVIEEFGCFFEREIWIIYKKDEYEGNVNKLFLKLFFIEYRLVCLILEIR